jgi:hypothetical protein
VCVCVEEITSSRVRLLFFEGHVPLVMEQGPTYRPLTVSADPRISSEISLHKNIIKDAVSCLL